MVIVSNVLESCVIETWLALLQAGVKVCKDSCPTWEVCFTKKEGEETLFNEMRAREMLLDQEKKVRQGHNRLHTTLQKVGMGAIAIGLTPRMQDNEQTASGVAVAQKALKDAKVTSSLIVGFESLEKYKLHPLGPSKARAYLKEHKTQANMEALPTVWWVGFEQLSNEAAAIPVQVATADAQVPPAVCSAKAEQPLAKEKVEARGALAPSSGGAPLVADAPEAEGAVQAKPGLKRRRRG